MAVELLLAPEAERDLVVACEWYEARRVGLGEDFLDRVDACLQAIRRNPFLYPVVHEDYRRALVRRFPFAIFYEPTDERVMIYAVLHSSRDPLHWLRRTP
jgi:plasmid stabilization system protein ParE